VAAQPQDARDAGYTGSELVQILFASTTIHGEHAVGNVESAPADGSSAPSSVSPSATISRAVTTKARAADRSGKGRGMTLTAHWTG
jgi:hypothetical protein